MWCKKRNTKETRFAQWANRVLPCLLSALLVCACGVKKDRVRIEGKFAHIKTGDFYVYSEYGHEGFDTIKLDRGSFSYECKLTEPTILLLQYPNFSQTLILAEPGKTIEVDGDAESLATTKVEGTEQNKLFTDLRLSLKDKRGKEQSKIVADFIRSHSEAWAAEAAFRFYVLGSSDYDSKETTNLLTLLRRKQPANNRLQALDSWMLPYLKNSKGGKLPPFTIKDIKGNVVNNASYKGKSLLINFWATWNSESCRVLGELNGNKKKWNKQNLAILNISIDADKQGVERRIQNDSIPGTNVCENLVWESPLVKTFGIRYVPGNILINEKGIIVGRDLSAEQLESEIKKLR